MNRDVMIEQLRSWADIVATELRAYPEGSDLDTVAAGMRDIAADLEREGAATTNEYAKIVWTVEDVQTLREDLTDEQADAFLNRAEKHLRDRLTELGWDVMGTLLDMDDELPSKPEDNDTVEGQ